MAIQTSDLFKKYSKPRISQDGIEMFEAVVAHFDLLEDFFIQSRDEILKFLNAMRDSHTEGPAMVTKALCHPRAVSRLGEKEGGAVRLLEIMEGLHPKQQAEILQKPFAVHGLCYDAATAKRTSEMMMRMTPETRNAILDESGGASALSLYLDEVQMAVLRRSPPCRPKLGVIRGGTTP